MSKRSTSQNVPKEMQARFDEITRLTDTFSEAHLNDEYKDHIRQLTATLCRKRPSPLSGGKANTWACALIHALGTVNFLFDSSQKPYIPISRRARSRNTSVSVQARCRQSPSRSATSLICIKWLRNGRSHPWSTVTR